MKINNMLEQLDTTERKEENVLYTIANNLSKKDKKYSERPMRMFNMLQKITENVNISKDANEMIKESLEEIESKMFLKKEGLSLGYFPGIQSNILLFKFLSEAKSLNTSSAYVIKELYENKKQEVQQGDWFIVENGSISMYNSGKSAIIDWTEKTGTSLNENRFFLRVKLLKEADLANRAVKAQKNQKILHDIKEFYEF